MCQSVSDCIKQECHRALTTKKVFILEYSFSIPAETAAPLYANIKLTCFNLY